MMVYQIFRPRQEKLFEPGYEEYQRLDLEFRERVRHLMQQRINGMDRILLNFVLRSV
jgi:hypothetical protein